MIYHRESAPKHEESVEQAKPFMRYEANDAKTRRVAVRQPDGSIEKGWFLVGEEQGETPDHDKYVAIKLTEDGETQKRIPKAEQDALLEELSQKRAMTTRPLGSSAVGVLVQEPIYRPTTLDERVQAGYNVPRSELHNLIDRVEQNDRES